MLEWFAARSARLRVPQPRGVVITSGQHRLPIRTERRYSDPILMNKSKTQSSGVCQSIIDASSPHIIMLKGELFGALQSQQSIIGFVGCEKSLNGCQISRQEIVVSGRG